jgi:hypothetical protein
LFSIEKASTPAIVNSKASKYQFTSVICIGKIIKSAILNRSQHKSLQGRKEGRKEGDHAEWRRKHGIAPGVNEGLRARHRPSHAWWAPARFENIEKTSNNFPEAPKAALKNTNRIIDKFEMAQFEQSRCCCMTRMSIM